MKLSFSEFPTKEEPPFSINSFFTDFPIRQIREWQQITQEDAADKIQMSRASWIRLEQKTTQEISLQELSQICRALNLNWEEFTHRLNYLLSQAPQHSQSKPVTTFEPQLVVIRGRTSFPLIASNKGKCFFSVLKGMCILFKDDQEHVFKTGESFWGLMEGTHELFNPHLLHDAHILFQSEIFDRELSKTA